MNAVEIEEAISVLAERPFDPEEFPFAFLEAFGNKETTIKRLRKGESNKSDLGGVLQTHNIHIAVCKAGEVLKTLTALKASPATARAKAVNPRFHPRWQASNRGPAAPAPGEVAGGSGWSDRSALLRTPLSHGPGAWRASGRPG